MGAQVGNTAVMPGAHRGRKKRDLVYRVVIRIFRAYFVLMGIRFDIRGGERLPSSGPAVVAMNHISYLDYTFVGLVADQRHRKIRFLAKASIFKLPVIGSLLRAMDHVPVERSSGSGAGAYRHAERALRNGELVGVFPEATISRAWTLKPFKWGAVNLATEQQVPLIPVITWGGQRLLTVDHRYSFRRHIPVTVLVGVPIDPAPGRSAEDLNSILRDQMELLLGAAQQQYPDRPTRLRDAWWLPRHLGGTAPDPGQAAQTDEARIRH